MEHPVARIDDTVNADNVHERAEAVAVPDFDYVGQTIEGLVSALMGGSEPEKHAARRHTR